MEIYRRIVLSETASRILAAHLRFAETFVRCLIMVLQKIFEHNVSLQQDSEAQSISGLSTRGGSCDMRPNRQTDRNTDGNTPLSYTGAVCVKMKIRMTSI